jgi:hypothetical protein
MVATSTAVRGLSTSDLEQIRDSLKSGRKPKVVFTESAGQIAGQQGQVVQLTDPQLSDEWVVVRFGRDELPFSPADLAIPAKSTTVRRANASTEPATPAIAATVPAPREETIVPSSPTSTVDAAAKPVDKATSKSVDKPAETPVDKQNGAATPAAKAALRKALPKAKPSASLTVTLAYTEGEWTVGAQQGSKALAKPYVIRATDALKMVSMLDVPGVQEAVEEIVASARAAAEREAERLRSELAEIEAKLAELVAE